MKTCVRTPLPTTANTHAHTRRVMGALCDTRFMAINRDLASLEKITSIITGCTTDLPTEGRRWEVTEERGEVGEELATSAGTFLCAVSCRCSVSSHRDFHTGRRRRGVSSRRVSLQPVVCQGFLLFSAQRVGFVRGLQTQG